MCCSRTLSILRSNSLLDVPSAWNERQVPGCTNVVRSGGRRDLVQAQK